MKFRCKGVVFYTDSDNVCHFPECSYLYLSAVFVHPSERTSAHLNTDAFTENGKRSKQQAVKASIQQQFVCMTNATRACPQKWLAFKYKYIHITFSRKHRHKLFQLIFMFRWQSIYLFSLGLLEIAKKILNTLNLSKWIQLNSCGRDIFASRHNVVCTCWSSLFQI